MVFHGKKASLFIRSKRDQEKVSSKTLGYRASATHSSTHNERLVYASSLKTHSIASAPLEDDLSIVDVDDDASSILSGSELSREKHFRLDLLIMIDLLGNLSKRREMFPRTYLLGVTTC